MPSIKYIRLKMLIIYVCIVSVPRAHGFQTIPLKNSCRAVCAEMFQNLVVMAVILTDLSRLVKHTLIHQHAILLPTLTPCSYHQMSL